jgi:hypothetical protein
MQLEKKLKNFLICLSLISLVFATPLQAAPSIIKVDAGDTSPFDGWCLTKAAMAKIVADKELEGDRCQLKLDKQSDQLSAKFKLELGILETRVETTHSEYLSMMQIKNEEINRLEQVALDAPNDYWYLFTAGGFVVGATTVLGIWALVAR